MSLPQSEVKAQGGGASGDPPGALHAPPALETPADPYAQAIQASWPNDAPATQHTGRQRLDGMINYELRRRIMRSLLLAAVARTSVPVTQYLRIRIEATPRSQRACAPQVTLAAVDADSRSEEQIIPQSLRSADGSMAASSAAGDASADRQVPCSRVITVTQ